MSTFDMNFSGCAWCHPGGGSMEYDRQGYRLDGAAGLFQGGGISDPSTKQGDYYIYGMAAGAETPAGSGYFLTTTTTGLYNPATTNVINQGTIKIDGSGNMVGKIYKNPAAASGGVAEADCLMCHLNAQYPNQQRNYAFPAATAPKLAATLGMHGIKSTVATAANGNPNPASWTWNGTGDVTLTADEIAATPKRENCALCHFPDGSNATVGPGGKKLGFTAFQKMMLAGEAVDGDEIIGVNGKDGKNDADWVAVKGRVEGGKRAESINVGFNPDAHMDTARGNLSCVDCHYLLSGSFPALKDASLNVIQPAMDVWPIDHQFAKGNNAPDGKNMDQMDNTVTCASCHISHTHPSLTGPDANGKFWIGTKEVKTPAHAGFPGFHFTKIDCKTCHIPVLNAPMKQDLADFTAGPWRTFERAASRENGTVGVGDKPLYMWRATEHDGTGLQIEPIMTMCVALWANGTAFDGNGYVTDFGPTFQRAAKKAAENYRAAIGDTNADGVYEVKLNDATDKVLIFNTTTEITGMVAQLRALTPSVAEPVQHMYFNQFAASHNVLPKAAQTATKAILGSSTGGGCVMCHSSNDPASPNYSPKSVGFFNRNHTLCSIPLQQTIVDGKKRVNVKFSYKKPDGSSATVTLHGANAGDPTTNTLNQGTILGYSSSQLAMLADPATPDVGKPTATFTYAKNGLTVSFNASAAYCPSGNCSYTWNFSGAGSRVDNPLNDVQPKFKYDAAGTYNVTLTAIDNTNATQDVKTASITVAALATPPTCDFTTSVTGGAVTVNETVSTDVTKQAIIWGDGSVAQTTTGNTWSPLSHTYTVAGTYNIALKVKNAAGLTCTAKHPVTVTSTKYNISGHITSGGNGVSGVTVTITGPSTSRTVYTDGNGLYAVYNLKAGAYTVTPSKTGSAFTPISLSVTLGPTVTNADFTSP